MTLAMMSREPIGELEMRKCQEAHPDNNEGSFGEATYIGGSSAHAAGQPMVQSSRRGKMFCQRDEGHAGRHACNRNWSDGVMGEQQQWGDDMEMGRWVCIPFFRSPQDRAKELRASADQLDAAVSHS